MKPLGPLDRIMVGAVGILGCVAFIFIHLYNTPYRYLSLFTLAQKLDLFCLSLPVSVYCFKKGFKAKEADESILSVLTAIFMIVASVVLMIVSLHLRFRFFATP